MLTGGPNASPLWSVPVSYTPSGTGGTESGTPKDWTPVSASSPLPVAGTVTAIGPVASTEITGQTTSPTGASSKFWSGRPTGVGTAAVVNTDSSSTVYIGPSGTSRSTGFPLLPGQGMTFDPHLDQYSVAFPNTAVIAYIGAYV